MRLMRLLPQRRVPNRPRAAGSSQAGQRFQDRGPDDPDAAEQPPWLMRATRAFAARQGHAVRRAVMVTGFSQGASAALGLGRALQDHADSWFRLGALAPISVAYDFRDRVCAGWTPAAPTRLYYAAGDEQAVNGNTFSCQAKFAARGPRIPAVNVGAPDNHGSRHSGSNAAGAAAVVRWFRELERQPRPPASRA